MTTAFTSSSRVIVETGSRLHFGLLSGGQPGRQFGGAGCMIDHPRIRIAVEQAETFSASGPHSERVSQFARTWANWKGSPNLPTVRISVDHVPEQHTGLGVGTQLGLAVAAGLHRIHSSEPLLAEDLAASTGRGRRSAVGTHGFVHGGFLVDDGKHPEESLGALAHRVDMPEAWRFVLIRASEATGVAGLAETRAFDRLDAGSVEARQSMQNMIELDLLPAVEKADFDRFAEALYQYGTAAGECFSSLQGGIYAFPETADLVARLQSLGVVGVGQSSWGPTVFASCPDESTALHLVEQIRTLPEYSQVPMAVVRPQNQGAAIWNCPRIGLQ